MSKRGDLPVMLGSGLHKGYMIVRSKNLTGFDMYIVWLKREFQTGETFELRDIDKVDSVLHFCDKEAVRQTINGLKKMLKMWGGGKSCRRKT